MTLLDLLILALYFALAHYTAMGVTTFTLFVLTLVLIVVRVLRGERI